MKIECSFCGKALKLLGALLFSPPKNNRCIKYHICQDCYNAIIKVGRIVKGGGNE